MGDDGDDGDGGDDGNEGDDGDEDIGNHNENGDEGGDDDTLNGGRVIIKWPRVAMMTTMRALELRGIDQST